jgi:hypothetical protein
MDRHRKYGLFFQDIPASEVPFDRAILEDFDIIENVAKQRLLYRKRQNAYQFVHNDVTQFISEEQMMGECTEFSFIENDFSKSPWHKL